VDALPKGSIPKQMGLEASEEPISERWDLLSRDQRAGYRRVESSPLMERMRDERTLPLRSQMAKVELRNCLEIRHRSRMGL
jgi:hypothetical protein